MILIFFGILASLVIALLCDIRILKKSQPFIYPPPPLRLNKPSEYYKRMESISLDILENQKPLDYTIILWWGFDGLELDENDNLKWISRKKEKESPLQQRDTSIYPEFCSGYYSAVGGGGTASFLSMYPTYQNCCNSLCQNTQAIINSRMIQSLSYGNVMAFPSNIQINTFYADNRIVEECERIC